MEYTQQNQEGVSNVEIDWFLRGKLPEATGPMPVPKKHVDEAPLPATPPPLPEKSIHEGLLQAHPHNPSAAEVQLGHVLRRSRSLPALDSNHEKDKKSGFFRSLFGKKKTKDNSSTESLKIHTPDNDPARHSRTTSPEPVKLPAREDTKLQKSKTSPSASDLDPRLEEFLRYYKAKGLDKLRKDIGPQPLDAVKPQKSAVSSGQNSDTSSITSSVQSSLLDQKSQVKPRPKKLDALGRPIPAHPPKAPLPPAIIKNAHFEVSQKQEIPAANNSAMTSTSRLTGFLRRHQSTISENSLSCATSITSASENLEKPDSKKHFTEGHSKPVAIPGLEDLPKLKRVSFDVPVFFNDPPQQIPSRTPRKGEVEILKDGSIIIHKLTAAERRQILAQSGGGIVVGGTGHLKVIPKPQEVAKAEETVIPSETANADDPEHAGQHHSIKVAAAAAAAEARAMDGSQLTRVSTNNDEEVTVSAGATKISIDKPMVRHNKSSVSLHSLQTHDDSDGVFPPRNTKVPLDILYTRCCHLREILPIPATLKQIKPGSTDPVSLLQLRNPKPSLVEVLTFADFISVAPILCISLDGVSLSPEMFRIILASLVHKTELEKLSLRNTPIDDMGWKLLCWFLTKNGSLSRLDLTQVPSLQIGVQKPAKSNTSSVQRMECDLSSRSDMNWNLMSAALASRGGVEELVINGAKMSDAEFYNLTDIGITPKTTKIGLAYNDLTLSQFKSMTKGSKGWHIIGLDLGYNDLSDKLETLLEAAQSVDYNLAAIQYLSLNSCNLHNVDSIVGKVFNELSVLKDLRYIDLSNNKKLFPSAMMSLIECLPIFPKLARIHLDYNDLTQGAIVEFAELIPFCKSLRYISLIGNKVDAISAAALANAIKLSKTVMTLDLDYDDVPPKYRESIGLHTVRNMQNNLYSQTNEQKSATNNDREMDGLREQLSRLLLHEGEDDPDPVVVKSFLQKALQLRERIHESIEELFSLKLQGKLNVEGNEELVRFCFVDSSIEKGLNLLSKRPMIHKIYARLQYGHTPVSEPDLSDHRKLLSDASCPTPLSSSPTSTIMSRHSSSNLVLDSFMDSARPNGVFPFGRNNSEPDSNSDDELKPIKDDDLHRLTSTADNVGSSEI